MSLRSWQVALAFLTLTFCLEAFAAHIEISDGSVIVGEIVERSGELYTIRMRSGAEIEIRGCHIVDVAGVEVNGGALGESVYGRPALRFQGSNAIGEVLVPALAEAYVLAVAGSDTTMVAGKREDIKVLEVGAAAGCVPKLVEVRTHGSDMAFTALASGEADIGMSSRPIKHEEVDNLKAVGDLSQPDAEHVLALDGVAVIVHPRNPLRALDRGKLAKIFAGEITDWSALGGNRGQITIYARDDKSATYDTFNSLVLNSQGRSLSPAARRYESSEKLSHAVASDPSGIGFVGLTHIRKAKALAIKECGMNYRPSAFAVKTEEYPLARRLFLYAPINSQSSESSVNKFLNFALSDEGQEAVRETGFVDLGIEASGGGEATALQLSHMQWAVHNTWNWKMFRKFVKTTADATRLSVTFRFRKGSARLDSRALDDIQRLTAYMSGPQGSGKQLMLLGFTDAVGDFKRNIDLSWWRAQTVATELVRNGVSVALVRGFGKEAPVACNASARGRRINRRVEAWVKETDNAVSSDSAQAQDEPEIRQEQT